MKENINDPTALLFGAYRRQVLAFLLGRPAETFHVREIARRSDVPVGSVHRELRALAGAGILRRTPVERQVRYQADRASPLFGPLAAIFGAPAGRYSPAPVLALRAAEPAANYIAEPPAADRRRRALDRLNVSRGVLVSFARRHRLAKVALFGSVTRNDFGPGSDVDVLIEFAPEHPRAPFDRVDISDELSALFGGRKVDVVTRGVFRNPIRRASIERDLVTVHDAG